MVESRLNHQNLYIPRRGDIVYLNLSPTKGHEQSGHRPAFVLSPLAYNQKTFLGLFMPITRQQKGYPFEVVLPADLQVQGVILADQIKCLDWQVRGLKYIECVPESIVEEVQGKVQALLL
ncbi:MAG: endoribonuclease MazF [Pseudanabaenaceae cyanobacterium]